MHMYNVWKDGGALWGGFLTNLVSFFFFWEGG